MATACFLTQPECSHFPLRRLSETPSVTHVPLPPPHLSSLLTCRRLPTETGPFYLGQACRDSGAIFCFSGGRGLMRAGCVKAQKSGKVSDFIFFFFRAANGRRISLPWRSSQAAIIPSPGSPRGRDYLSHHQPNVPLFVPACQVCVCLPSPSSFQVV